MRVFSVAFHQVGNHNLKKKYMVLNGSITQVCSGKIVFKISTFLHRVLCAELKKIIKNSITYHFFTKHIFHFKVYIFIRFGPLILYQDIPRIHISCVNGTAELRANTGPKNNGPVELL
jgi:hypothetical protein